MAPREITPAQALGIIAERIQERKEILRRVSETGYNIALSELDIVSEPDTEGAGLLREEDRDHGAATQVNLQGGLAPAP